MNRFYTYKMGTESANDALAEGRLFPSKEEVIKYVKKTEKEFSSLPLFDGDGEFKYTILTVDVREDEDLFFENGNLINK